MNEKKQLECELKCKASAVLSESVAEDMNKEDRNLQDLINGQESEDKN